MPSKKKIVQRMPVEAQQLSNRYHALMEDISSSMTSDATKQQVEKEAPQRTFAQAVKDGSQAQRRSSSQKSASTDEGGSSLSGHSESSPASSETPSIFPAFGEPGNPETTRTMCAEERHQLASDLNAHIQTSQAPMWVSNNSMGDAAAWLLVLPKFSSQVATRSPNDVILLGPYVSMKNTFLEESQVGGVLSGRQRARSKSIGACCFGLP